MNTPGPAELQHSLLLTRQAQELEKAGQIPQAAQVYQQAIRACPLNGLPYHELIRMLVGLDDIANAVKVLQATPLPLYQQSNPLQNLHAFILFQQGQHAEALEIYKRLEGKPDVGQAMLHMNIGSCHHYLKDPALALQHYQKARQAGLKSPTLSLNMAGMHLQLDDITAVRTLYQEARRQFPEDKEITHAIANFLLADEQFENGFRLYQQRWLSKQCKTPKLDLPLPAWTGKSRARSLLVTAEQGVGDEIAFSTLIPALAKKVEKLTVAFDFRLIPLLSRTWPHVHFIGKEPFFDKEAPFRPGAPDYVAHLHAADMGMHARETLGWKGGYLQPDREHAARLREKYQQRFPGKKLVGISWKSPFSAHGEARAAALQDWQPILGNTSCQFISLQYGDVSADLEFARKEMAVDIHHDTEIDSYRDLDGLAAQMAALDLVITIDNTTAHLAAAINVPTWVLLPTGISLWWYWGFKERSSWYPDTRLFRTKAGNPWEAITQEVAAALRTSG